MLKLHKFLFIFSLIILFAFFSNQSNVYAFSFFDLFSNKNVLGDEDDRSGSSSDEDKREDKEDDKDEEDKDREDEKEEENDEDENKEEEQKEEKYEFEQRVTNDDGTETRIKIKRESGKEKMEVKKYDTYGNKISESKYESEEKEDGNEAKLETEMRDFETGVHSKIRLETTDNKVFELKTTESTELSKVEFEFEKGEVKIRYKNNDEESENKFYDDQEIKVKVSGDGFELEDRDIIAQVNFPISIDQETGKIYIETNKGQVVLNILPEQAMQQIVAKSQSFTADQIQVEENSLNDKLTYNVKGTEQQNLLGLFSVDIFKTFNVDATDGEIISQDQSIYSKILDLLSI